MSSYYDSGEDGVPPPEHTAVRPLEELSTRNDKPLWDETDESRSFSAFLREANSVGPVNPHRKEETSTHSGLASEADQNNNESPLDIGDLKGEPTVKQFSFRKALTVPETITIQEACCQMAAEKAHVLVLTDSNALVSGILTYKDIVTKAIACELDLVSTEVSTVMTKNPITVSSDTLAMEALLKIHTESVNQLPVVENGEVIGIIKQLDYLSAVATELSAVEEGYDYKVVLADAIYQCWKRFNEELEQK